MTTPQLTGMCPLIQVFDMRTSLRFYRDLLGFQIVNHAPANDDCNWVWLRRDGMELMLNTMYESDARPSGRDAARHDAHGDTCLFFGCPDLDAMHAYLAARGIDASKPIVRDYGMKQFYLRDPDGYGICFQCPSNPASHA